MLMFWIWFGNYVVLIGLKSEGKITTFLNTGSILSVAVNKAFDTLSGFRFVILESETSSSIVFNRITIKLGFRLLNWFSLNRAHFCETTSMLARTLLLMLRLILVMTKCLLSCPDGWPYFRMIKRRVCHVLEFLFFGLIVQLSSFFNLFIISPLNLNLSITLVLESICWYKRITVITNEGIISERFVCVGRDFISKWENSTNWWANSAKKAKPK